MKTTTETNITASVENTGNPTVPVDNTAAISQEKLNKGPIQEENISFSNNKLILIYGLIEEEFFDEIKIFPDRFLQKYKNNYDKPQLIPKLYKEQNSV